ncbi:hypothetical protein C1H46_025241 [Malus baccata]|uniref:Uncharacterized protein n=1 Tax=Malus baccata TaxID=106549 RepID=A0A540LS32_MALBA|nr:hypothetical protein C1H46_025241 [Malus baccata]
MKSYRASLISVNSDHDQCRKKKVFVKLVSTKKQANMDHITGDNIPRSFVFSRCKLPGPLKQLQVDLRKLMLPYTALKLKRKKVCIFALIFGATDGIWIWGCIEIENVSGEWDGHGADFTREGCPIELPENVVPASYREWEVSIDRLNAPLLLT